MAADLPDPAGLRQDARVERNAIRESSRPDLFEYLQAVSSELIQSQRELDRRAREIDEIRDLFERLIESMSDALFLLDDNGQVLRVNRAATVLVQRRAEELSGQLFSNLSGASRIPATAPEVLALAPSGSLSNLEATLPDATGRPTPVSISCSLVRDRRGRIAGVLVIARDISELKRAREAEKELTQLKEDFVASVSHELRTPLASIKGFADLLLKGRVPEEATRLEFLTRVHQEADRLLLLVNHVLDISRMETGGLVLDLSEFDINELVGETLHSLQGVATQKRISIASSAAATATMIQADRRRLQQVLVNILGNAIKYSGFDQSIEILVKANQGALQIQIRDHGLGIPADALPKIFDKFYQARHAGHRAATGTGLGLYISKHIVEAHGGRIDVESELGFGATFRITLPTEITIGE